MDGKSIAPFLLHTGAGAGASGATSEGPLTKPIPQSSRAHVAALLADGGIEAYRANWREEVLLA